MTPPSQRRQEAVESLRAWWGKPPRNGDIESLEGSRISLDRVLVVDTVRRPGRFAWIPPAHGGRGPRPIVFGSVEIKEGRASISELRIAPGPVDDELLATVKTHRLVDAVHRRLIDSSESRRRVESNLFAAGVPPALLVNQRASRSLSRAVGEPIRRGRPPLSDDVLGLFVEHLLEVSGAVGPGQGLRRAVMESLSRDRVFLSLIGADARSREPITEAQIGGWTHKARNRGFLDADRIIQGPALVKWRQARKGTIK